MFSSLVLLTICASCWLSTVCFNGIVNLVDAVPLVIVLFMCASCCLAAICDAVGLLLPNNLVLATFSTVLSAASIIHLRGYRVSARPNVSKAYHDLHDGMWGVAKAAAPYLVLAAVAIICAFVQFGPSLLINFASTDPGTHFNKVMLTLETERLSTSLWFTHYISARGVELMAPFLSVGSEYKAFIAMEVIYFLLNGCLFFGIAKRLSPSRSWVCVSLVITVIYLLAYPLNVLTFGFSYLGVGVTLCLALVTLSRGDKKGCLFRCCLAALLLFSLSICYSLFVPIALLGLLVAFILRKRSFVAKHAITFSVCLAVFAFSCIALIMYVINTGAVSGLSASGYSYVNLYGDFLLPLPFAMFGLFALFKGSREEDASICGVTLATICAVLVAIALYREGIFSSYYYYKLYHVLWACVLLCAARGIAVLRLRCPEFVCCYGVVWVCIIAVASTGVDERLFSSRSDFNPFPSSTAVAGVYACNAREMLSPRIPDSEVELWEAANSLRSSEDDYVPLFGTNIDVYWYQAVTRQHYRPDSRYFLFWLYDESDWAELYIERLSGVEYCAVLFSQELPAELADFFGSKEVMFENSAGIIYKLV